MIPSTSRVNWSRVSADPDPHQDLDYRLVDLDVFSVDDSETVIVLPNETDMLRENAFVVTREQDLCDLRDWV